MAIDRAALELPVSPNAYRELSEVFAGIYASRSEMLAHVLQDISRLARSVAPASRLYGRIKGLQSTLFKMQRDGCDLDHVLDLVGVRVIVASTLECYSVVEQIHGSFLFLENEFDDYIASPKPNGYRSLHTTILLPNGYPVEVQVRTEKMHALSSQGAAAHRCYKEQGVRADA